MLSYLQTLPLHTITEVYGEAGLRDRFSREIERFAEPDWRRLNKALSLASDLHRQDRRAREPVVNHLLRVTLRVMCHYEVNDVDILVAALLHDTVEDHPVELAGEGHDDTAEMALGVLSAEFGPRVAGLVRAVTNPAYDRTRDVHAQYRAHVVASLDRHPAARVIKVSDFTDNGVGLIHTTGPKLRKLAMKYRPLVPELKELVNRPDTPLTAPIRLHIVRQLDRADERFTAILHGPGERWSPRWPSKRASTISTSRRTCPARRPHLRFSGSYGRPWTGSSASASHATGTTRTTSASPPAAHRSPRPNGHPSARSPSSSRSSAEVPGPTPAQFSGHPPVPRLR